GVEQGLRAELLGGAGLDAPADAVEQTARPAGTKVLERRTAIEQGGKGVPFQHQAEGVLHGSVDGAGRALLHEGAHREALPCCKQEGGVDVAVQTRALAADLALLDDVETVDWTVL